MSRMPRKHWKKRFGDRVRSCSVRFFLTQTRLALLSSAQLFDVFFLIDWAKVFDFTI